MAPVIFFVFILFLSFRDWHPTLIATRKAWSVPRTPAYFDCLNFYKYITKTRLIEGSLDNFYKGLVPPTANFEVYLNFAAK